MREDDDVVEVEVVAVVAETDKAILCRLDEGRQVWVPKSVIGEDSEVQAANDEGVLVVAEWFAEKEGL